AMCQPSATSAIEPKSEPPTISTSIIAAVSATTHQVRRSYSSWRAPRKAWPCVQGVIECGCMLRLVIGPAKVEIVRVLRKSGGDLPRVNSPVTIYPADFAGGRYSYPTAFGDNLGRERGSSFACRRSVSRSAELCNTRPPTGTIDRHDRRNCGAGRR